MAFSLFSSAGWASSFTEEDFLIRFITYIIFGSDAMNAAVIKIYKIFKINPKKFLEKLFVEFWNLKNKEYENSNPSFLRKFIIHSFFNSSSSWQLTTLFKGAWANLTDFRISLTSQIWDFFSSSTFFSFSSYASFEGESALMIVTGPSYFIVFFSPPLKWIFAICSWVSPPSSINDSMI